MSLNEIKNLSIMMRTLGYARPISKECLKTPNFPLVAEILHWLAQQFDSKLGISKRIESEQDRIIFMKSIVQFLSTKSSIKLNPKRLYEADRHAFKEILKLVKVLYAALKLDKDIGSTNKEYMNMSEVVKQLQLTRSLTSQLTTICARLKSIMVREPDFREARIEAIGRNLDAEWVEKCLSDATRLIWDEVWKLENALFNIKEDEKALDERIEKRRQELERNQIRLFTLRSVRPAYMDEYEQLEEELKIHYETYLNNFRNISYLESLQEGISTSDNANENVVDFVNKFVVGEAQITSFGVDAMISRTENVDTGENQLASFRNFDVNKLEETYSSSDQTDSEESITLSSVNHQKRDFDFYKSYDFVEGLSVIGHGYGMVGDWSPYNSGDKVGGNPDSAFTRDDEISSYDVDKAIAEFPVETNKLKKEMENEQKASRKLKSTGSNTMGGFPEGE